MNIERIRELRKELQAEGISYGELAEIDSAVEEAGIEIKEGMMAGDFLDELEQLASHKKKKLRDPAQDTPELAKEDAAIQSFDYELGQFRKYFTTPFEQYAEHIGKPFTMVKRLPDAEPVDEGPGEDMWLIRFEDGTEIQAWGHEVCLLWDETDESEENQDAENH